MAENPLLPNAELRALYDLLKRAAKAEATAARTASKSGLTARSRQPGSREALLAGTLLQLRPGDVLVAEPGDLVPSGLLPQPAEDGQPIAFPALRVGTPQLMIAAGIAAAAKSTGKDPVVLSFVRSGHRESDWAEALGWAQDAQLPLILAIADPSGANTFRRTPEASAAATMSWSSVQKTASRLKLPVLTVDGEDAVAMYRVMQESALRARSGGGPALLWAMLPSARELSSARPSATLPLRRLERYLRTRKIPL